MSVQSVNVDRYCLSIVFPILNPISASESLEPNRSAEIFEKQRYAYPAESKTQIPKNLRPCRTPTWRSPDLVTFHDPSRSPSMRSPCPERSQGADNPEIHQLRRSHTASVDVVVSGWRSICVQDVAAGAQVVLAASGDDTAPTVRVGVPNRAVRLKKSNWIIIEFYHDVGSLSLSAWINPWSTITTYNQPQLAIYKTTIISHTTTIISHN